MREETRELDGAVDFETGKPRKAKVAYVVRAPELPPGERARGLIFLIPGFGADTDPGYAARLRRHMNEAHGLVAVSVQYHCIGARPETGAQVTIDQREHQRLLGIAALSGLEVADKTDINALCAAFTGRPEQPAIGAVLNPPNGDLQNFGLVQAMDHLQVLGDLVKKGPAFDPRRVMALGSSHGGYIAQMMAKIAPGTLAGVIDNSSYVQPPIAYAAGGEHPEYTAALGGVRLHCRTARAWSYDDRSAPDFYSRDRDLIRDLGYPPHLEIQRAADPAGGPVIRMVNATADTISRPETKARQAAFMAAAGFDAALQLVGEGDIDGKLFKKLVHGLDASLAGLADRHIPAIPARAADPDLMRGTVIEYPCVDEIYRFEHLDRFPYVRGSRRDRFMAPAENAA
jgi:hypothetical protein